VKVIWLNDSLVLRADNQEERKALAVVFNALEPKEKSVNSQNEESAESAML
jgi:hypothetical protein